jgi:hypothetical protein
LHVQNYDCYMYRYVSIMEQTDNMVLVADIF